MIKWGTRVLLLFGVAMFGGCAALLGPPEGLSFRLPEDKPYKYAQEYSARDAYLTRFVLEGESIDNWNEGVEIYNTLRRNYPPTPRDAYRSITEGQTKKCPESVFNVIKVDYDSILFELKTINCPPDPDENLITRLLFGKVNVFSVSYTNKTRDLPSENRDEWIKVLSEAAITTSGPPPDAKPVR